MIPLRDNIPSRTRPVVNYTIIVLSAMVFFAQLQQERGKPGLVERYGMIPARVVDPDQPIEIPDREIIRTPRGLVARDFTRPAAESAVPPAWTLLSCIFLHGGWLHFLGNMWFLHIFGDNVEDRFGHVGYLLFYLGCGVAASAAHLMVGPDSTIPTIGASGAIAGVMGAYFLLYPHAKVLTLVPIFIFLQVFVLPAPLFLGIWFLIQFYLGTVSAASTQSAGVAWWAHIGGFATGLAVAWLLGKLHRLRPSVETRLPNTDRIAGYRIQRRGPWN